MDLFQIHSKKANTNVWSWPWNKVASLSTNIIIRCCFSFDGRRLGTSHYGGRQNCGTSGLQNNIFLATVSVYTQVELVQLHNILVLMLWEQPPFVSWPKPHVRSCYLSLCNWISFIWAYEARWCRKTFFSVRAIVKYMLAASRMGDRQNSVFLHHWA